MFEAPRKQGADAAAMERVNALQRALTIRSLHLDVEEPPGSSTPPRRASPPRSKTPPRTHDSTRESAHAALHREAIIEEPGRARVVRRQLAGKINTLAHVMGQSADLHNPFFALPADLSKVQRIRAGGPALRSSASRKTPKTPPRPAENSAHLRTNAGADTSSYRPSAADTSAYLHGPPASPMEQIRGSDGRFKQVCGAHQLPQ